MSGAPQPSGGPGSARSGVVLAILTLAFAGLAILFAKDAWGRFEPVVAVPPVDKKLLDTAPARKTYADLVRAKEDLSDYDCYACHEKNKPPLIRFEANNRIVIPKEHSNISPAHGSHDRTNLCYNCHNEQNLLTYQGSDRRELKFDNVPALCGTCHGPVLRDWEAGAHGRTSGYWDRKQGAAGRLTCTNCHDPHAPRFPGLAPAPGPQPPRGPAPKAH